jgi:hypothetical protein
VFSNRLNRQLQVNKLFISEYSGFRNLQETFSVYVNRYSVYSMLGGRQEICSVFGPGNLLVS